MAQQAAGSLSASEEPLRARQVGLGNEDLAPVAERVDMVGRSLGTANPFCTEHRADHVRLALARDGRQADAEHRVSLADPVRSSRVQGLTPKTA